jgi:hypothetical protein
MKAKFKKKVRKVPKATLDVQMVHIKKKAPRKIRTSEEVLLAKKRKFDENRINYSLRKYSKDRTLELNEQKRANLVDVDAQLAYDMVLLYADSSYKTGSIFFKDKDHKHGVAVLFMDARQELIVTAGPDKLKVSLATQYNGHADALNANYARFGIFDVPQVRPVISKVQNVFDTKFHNLMRNDNKKQNIISDPQENKQSMLKWEAERFGTSEGVKLEVVVKPDELESVSASLITETVPADVFSPEKLAVIKLTSGSNKKVASFTSGREQYTLIESPGEELHLEISPSAQHTKPGAHELKFPYAHYSLDEWSSTSWGTEANYRSIHKGNWAPQKGKVLEVKTFKQLREEDRRHLERLRSEHAWRQKLSSVYESD